MIQIITNRNDYFKGWKIETISSFSSPKAFDSYEINLIDLNDESLWRNRENNLQLIEIANDLASIKTMITSSNKTKCVIIFPQNCKYRYYYGLLGGNKGYGYLKWCLLKDMLDLVSQKILKSLIPPKWGTYAVSYENNVTDIGGIKYNSSFYFSEYIGQIALTVAKDSDKITTVQCDDRAYLTTLNILENEEVLRNYLFGIHVLQRGQSQYPGWLMQTPMFNDIELGEKVIACNKAIEEIEKKRDQYRKELQANLEYKSILYTNGNELVEKVFRILEVILDYDLSKFVDEKKEDFRIELESEVLIGEIKGVTSNIKSENISQVDVHVQSYLDEVQGKGQSKYVKPILIMNPFRNKPLDKREPVHEIQLKLAKRNECLIIETITLLRIFEKFRKKELTVEQIIEKIINTSGLLSISDFDSEGGVADENRTGKVS